MDVLTAAPGEAAGGSPGKTFIPPFGTVGRQFVVELIPGEEEMQHIIVVREFHFGFQGETGRILSKMMEMQAKKTFPKPDLAGVTTDPLTGKKDKSSGQNKEKTGDKK